MTNTNSANEISLAVERTINAPIASVFNAWLDAKLLAKFMIPKPDMAEPEVKCNPVEGGAFTILMKPFDTVLAHNGIYRVIEPFNRIVFSWESGHSIDGSEVTLTFEERESSTFITLQQVKFFNEEAKEDHLKGWSFILQHLDQLVNQSK